MLKAHTHWSRQDRKRQTEEAKLGLKLLEAD